MEGPTQYFLEIRFSYLFGYAEVVKGQSSEGLSMSLLHSEVYFCFIHDFVFAIFYVNEPSDVACRDSVSTVTPLVLMMPWTLCPMM